MLAEAAGIVDRYTDMFGSERVTTDETRLAFLRSMGFDVTDERSAQYSLERIRDRCREELIAPVEVVAFGDPSTTSVNLRLPVAVDARRCEFEMEIRPEGEDETFVRLSDPRVRSGIATFRLPTSLGLGYHVVVVRVATPQSDLTGHQTKIVHPPTCIPVDVFVSGRKRFGIWANLYSIVSDANHGVGDLSDLRHLAEWATDIGAVFVGINPLNSTRNRGCDISPYSPLSRVYHNEIYLDVTAVPEFAVSADAQELASSETLRLELHRLKTSEHVDYEAVLNIKHRILRLEYATFRQSRGTPESARWSSFLGYIQKHGELLHLYATYRAISEYLTGAGQSAADWRHWPPYYRDPNTREVKQFQDEFAGEIDYHRWVQFELDRQMESVFGYAGGVMPVGICADLPLASSPAGADTWSQRHLFAEGVHLGAPPDDFAIEGQDWGLMPLVPDRLRQSAYDHWIRTVKTALRYAGALRIDHVMGLYRQFWIPAGQPGANGAYVRYPAKDLLGILALESRRNRALIIGEDLGTVPAGFQARMARWNVMSTRVFYFERNINGEFRPSRRYSKRAFVAAHTHDQVPLAGYLQGRDIQLRRDVGVLQEGTVFDHAMEQRRREVEALNQMLGKEDSALGALAGDDTAATPAAVYGFLARTDSPLLGISLDDLAGETDPVNIPGVKADRSKLWSRRMRVSLAEIRRRQGARAILEKVTPLRSA